MKEYPLSNFAKFFGYIFVAGVLIGAYFAFQAALDSNSQVSATLFHALVLGCIGIAIFFVREMKISKFVIAVDRVYLVSMIYKRSLALDQIKGWREVQEEIHILPNTDALKKIRVSTYFKNIGEIRYFLSEYYPNLDEVDIESATEEILQDEKFGTTIEARALRLEQARKAAKYTEWLGWAITAWLFLHPQPYTLSIVTGMLFPILAIGVCLKFKGIIRGDGEKTDGYPSVITSFILVSLMMALRAMMDINTLNYGHGWFLMGAVALILFLTYQFATSGFRFEKKSKYVTMFLLPIFTFSYGFGSLTLINAIADRSQPVVYQTEVAKKRVSSGKTTTYYLELKKWGDLNENEEVSVTRDKYNHTDIGHSVTVYQYPGLLKMPWLEVE